LYISTSTNSKSWVRVVIRVRRKEAVLCVCCLSIASSWLKTWNSAVVSLSYREWNLDCILTVLSCTQLPICFRNYFLLNPF
jgi:hypothetical protein